MQAPIFGAADYERALAGAGLGEVAVFHRQETGSTNDDARALLSSGALPEGTTAAIVVAETQTRGRGRGPNGWFSPAGSIALTITTSGVFGSKLGVLPLGVGAAVVWALRQLGAPAAVKWPNDVLIEGQKVCGILCESSLLSGTARVFIGIGINAGETSFSPEITGNATTLAAHGIIVDRPAVVADITGRVLSLIRSPAFGPRIVDDWKAVCVPWWGETVTFVEGEIERRVTVLDVNPDGQLVVRDEGGVLRSLASGEVRRLRPVHA